MQSPENEERKEMKTTIPETTRETLNWFRHSGVMRPADGSWGVAERVACAEEKAMQKMFDVFPAWTEYDTYCIIEQRRADCNFQTALLFLLAGDSETCGNILDYLYCRSGMLNRNENMLPFCAWNWSNISRGNSIWFDDNSWCLFCELAIAGLAPELDRKFRMSHYAMPLAAELARAFDRTMGDADKPGEWTDPEKIWSGRLELPHWGSLPVLALAAADCRTGKNEHRARIRRYHSYLQSALPRLTCSEYAYAALGAAMAYRSYGDETDLALLRQAAALLTAKADPVTGNLPAEHYEAPAGAELADLIYTLNWSLLGLQAAAPFDPVAADVKERQKHFLRSIQDTTDHPAFRGCWRGMFDCAAGCWGGGDLYEGGAGSIYTGWTNAPIAIGLLLDSRARTIVELI